VAIHVAVIDPLPMFQHGVAAVLSAAGYLVDEPADLVAWARRVPPAVILLTVGAEGDWRLLEQLRGAQTQAAVIAVVEAGGAGPGVRAVRAGARSVLLRETTAAAMMRTVEATVDGQAVLPAAVATALAAGGPPGQEELAPSEDQLTWLRRLATGTTVAQLAGDVGYSERAMYRLLQALYQQMGVGTRMQAIMRARDLGWLSL
jgi:DNA-binding NarL/FixJ family response regulator